jgi:manganese/zinc/iron transport system permease protein
MKTFLDFFTFSNPNVVYVVLGMIFINSSSALIGTFAFLRKRSLIGDAIAHSLLPGICIGFLFAGEKNVLALLTGAVISGWMSIFLVDYIVNHSRIKQDTAIGIVLSFFFALGIVLLTFIQNTGNGNQAGLDHFLFGQAAAITRSEVVLFAIIFVIIAVSVILFYRSFILISFNPDHAISIGLPVRFFEFVLTTLTVLAIAVGIQALGVILMSALIITPAAAARLWTHNLKKLLVIAMVFSVFSGISGAYVSYARAGMPTGPWVIVMLSFIVVMSICFAPGRGIFSRYLVRMRNAKKITDENILKTLYTITEKNPGIRSFNIAGLTAQRSFDTDSLGLGLKRLVRKGYLSRIHHEFEFTEAGKTESRRIVRLHRLWEQYLLKRTSIDVDHVHSGAEMIEHIITPEIEKELERELGIEGIPKEDY